jgi:integrase
MRSLSGGQVIPAIGHLPLARLGPAALQGYYAKKLETGVTSTTVHAHHRLLRTALGHAVRWGLIARNPAALTNPPRPQHRDVTVWDAEQVRLLLGEAKRSSCYYALYLTAMLTGMRQGELLGLRWQDVDFAMKTATVRQTVYRLGKRLTRRLAAS